MAERAGRRRHRLELTAEDRQRLNRGVEHIVYKNAAAPPELMARIGALLSEARASPPRAGSLSHAEDPVCRGQRGQSLHAHPALRGNDGYEIVSAGDGEAGWPRRSRSSPTSF